MGVEQVASVLRRTLETRIERSLARAYRDARRVGCSAEINPRKEDLIVFCPPGRESFIKDLTRDLQDVIILSDRDLAEIRSAARSPLTDLSRNCRVSEKNRRGETCEVISCTYTASSKSRKREQVMAEICEAPTPRGRVLKVDIARRR